MRIAVHYLAQLRISLGSSSASIDLPDPSTIANLFTHLASQHPTARVNLLNAAGEPNRSLLIFVGEERVDAGYHLREGDEVTILAPMAGGG